MRRNVVGAAALGVALVSVAAGVGAAGAEGRATRLSPAFEVFPGSVYDSPFTRSYAGAHGVVVVPSGRGEQPACLVVVNGLKPEIDYTVYLDQNGVTPGDAATAGPFVPVGSFTTNRGGHGDFRCDGAPGETSVFLNETAAETTVLISRTLPGG